uniref:Uncharacterized protein n=1 Tax=Glossina pallidipes TaxID=7398 RepID=A0A1B0A9F6_GLOPL
MNSNITSRGSHATTPGLLTKRGLDGAYKCNSKEYPKQLRICSIYMQTETSTCFSVFYKPHLIDWILAKPHDFKYFDPLPMQSIEAACGSAAQNPEAAICRLGQELHFS